MFSFDKRYRRCYISDTSEGSVNLTVSAMPGVVTLYKYTANCEGDLSNENETTRIGDGMVIPRGEIDLWEENPWTCNYSITKLIIKKYDYFTCV